MDPQQDKLLWSQPAVFTLQLIVGDDRKQAFKPTFHQMERLAQAVLDGALRTTFDIPRIGTQMMVVGSMTNNSNRTGANCIPTMELDDENMVKVR